MIDTIAGYYMLMGFAVALIVHGCTWATGGTLSDFGVDRVLHKIFVVAVFYAICLVVWPYVLVVLVRDATRGRWGRGQKSSS